MVNDTKPGDARHEQARDLAEAALEQYRKGNRKQGDALAEQAADLDRSAVEEVVAEIDEDEANRKRHPG
jgi:hypothetical protein